jgi:hypothetical protein
MSLIRKKKKRRKTKHPFIRGTAQGFNAFHNARYRSTLKVVRFAQPSFKPVSTKKLVRLAAQGTVKEYSRKHKAIRYGGKAVLATAKWVV